MDKNIKIAKKIKYVNIPDSQFIETKDIKKYKNEEVLILCTGTQGEENAALSKMSDGRLKKEIIVGKGDTVIFASSAIPGNYEKVQMLKNRLIKLQMNIIDNKIEPNVHGSGHAGKDEQQLMFSLIKPKNFVPVHGESYMLKKHSDTSISNGVGSKNTFILSNGGQVKFQDGKVTYGGQVDGSDVFVDSSSLSGQSSKVVSDREQMSTNGIVTVTVGINSKENKIIVSPRMAAKGAFNLLSNKALQAEVEKNVEDGLNALYNSGDRITFGGMKDLIKSKTEETILNRKKVSPIVVPIILNKKAE